VRKSAQVVLTVAVLALVVGRSVVAAQEAGPPDSARAQIRQTLRAFYFNLAHGDWEALTADILAAKVVAHRVPPSNSLYVEQNPLACGLRTGPQLDSSTIVLVGDWAEVFVPRCGMTLAGGDEFRMIYFQERWRLVGIHLFEEPLNLSTQH
jgi:hypothetical protein